GIRDFHVTGVQTCALPISSAIMFVLRLFAGSIIHKISPLGLLAVCSLVAAIGLFFLSQSVGVMILVAATIYGFGKAFFWPTMLRSEERRVGKECRAGWSSV